MTTREWVGAGVCCLVGFPLALLVLSGPRLFDRPFWADEVLSWLIASDPDFRHGMAALAGGVDTNAPLLHLIYRLVGEMAGHTPLTYRLVSTMAMSSGLLAVYACLRRTAGRLPSLGGTLAMLMLPIVLTHTTEARFYAILLAACAWTCFSIDSRLEKPRFWNACAVGIASVLLCGVHYFGVLILGCIVLFSMARALPRGLYRAFDVAWPALCGLVMTFCTVPLLRAQREALVAVQGTWIPDHFVQNFMTSMSMLMPPGTAVVIAALILVALVARRMLWFKQVGFPLTSLVALVGFPVILIAVDRLIQPVLVPRYLLPSLVVVAVLVCACLSVMTRRLQVVSALCLGAMCLAGAVGMRLKIAQPEPSTGMGILAHVPEDGVPVIVDWRGHLLPIWANRPSQRNRIAFVDDPRISHPDLDQAIPFEREMARILNRFYGFPKTITPAGLAQLRRFRLVTEFPESADERLGEVRIIQRTPLTLLVERSTEAAR